MGLVSFFFDPRNDVILYTETQISWTRTPLLRRCEKNGWFGKHDDEELRVNHPMINDLSIAIVDCVYMNLYNPHIRLLGMC